MKILKSLKIWLLLGLLTMALILSFYIKENSAKKQVELRLKTVSEAGRILPGTEINLFKEKNLINSCQTSSYGICALHLNIAKDSVASYEIELSDLYQGGSKSTKMKLMTLLPDEFWSQSEDKIVLERSLRF